MEFVQFNAIQDGWVPVSARRRDRKVSQALREGQSRVLTAIEVVREAATQSPPVIDTTTTTVDIDVDSDLTEDEHASFDDTPLRVDYEPRGGTLTSPIEVELDHESVTVLWHFFDLEI